MSANCILTMNKIWQRSNDHKCFITKPHSCRCISYSDKDGSGHNVTQMTKNITTKEKMYWRTKEKIIHERCKEHSSQRGHTLSIGAIENTLLDTQEFFCKSARTKRMTKIDIISYDHKPEAYIEAMTVSTCANARLIHGRHQSQANSFLHVAKDSPPTPEKIEMQSQRLNNKLLKRVHYTNN